LKLSARDGSPRSRQPHQLEMEVQPCWSVQAPEPQDLLAAGVAAMGPSASAASRGNRAASVWWPEAVGLEKDNVTLSGHGQGREESLQQGGRGARREALKHPCSIQGLEWCPGVLQRDSLNPADAGVAAGLEPHTLSPTTDGGSSSTATTLTEGAHQGQATHHSGVDDHPALMTLGSDGAVRIWVEMLLVQYSSPLSTTPAAATASPSKSQAPSQPHTQQASSTSTKQAGTSPHTSSTSLDSYFCMTLVIEPPPGYATLRALWTHALSTPSRSGSSGGGASGEGALWLVTTHRPNSTPPNPPCAATPVTNTHTPHAGPPTPPPPHGEDTATMTTRLYAVRGLSAVVVASFAGVVSGAGSVPSGGGRRPQAVLWGEHAWRLPPAVLPSAAPRNDGAVQGMSGLSAWVSEEASFPHVHVVVGGAGAECAGFVTVSSYTNRVMVVAHFNKYFWYYHRKY
jgi:hypothetical protein